MEGGREKMRGAFADCVWEGLEEGTGQEERSSVNMSFYSLSAFLEILQSFKRWLAMKGSLGVSRRDG